MKTDKALIKILFTLFWVGHFMYDHLIFPFNAMVFLTIVLINLFFLMAWAWYGSKRILKPYL